jgi:hypothetical protein
VYAISSRPRPNWACNTMDRPFNVSRSMAQFVRRRLPNRENVAYSIPSSIRPQWDERTKDQVSLSRRTSIYDGICKDGSFRIYQPIYEISSQLVDISGQCPKGFSGLKLAATPKNWKTRHYNHYLRLGGQERASEPLPRRRFVSGLRYHIPYMPFGQSPFTSSICSFSPNGLFSGRYFSTYTAVRPLSLT